MENKKKTWLRPVLGLALGAAAGLGYYYLIGCAGGACPLTAHPVTTAVYTALAGLLLSGVFSKECENSCNM